MTFEVQRPWHCLHSNHLVLTDTPTQLSQRHTKADPYAYRPKTILTVLLSPDKLTQCPVHAKVDPYTYRPKPFQASFFKDARSQLSPSPCKGRPTRLPTETIPTILFSQIRRPLLLPTKTHVHVNKFVLTDTPD
jgi:hypothetical protein